MAGNAEGASELLGLNKMRMGQRLVRAYAEGRAGLTNPHPASDAPVFTAFLTGQSSIGDASKRYETAVV